MPSIQAFQCPACGASLSYSGGPETTFACQYCGTTVILPEALRSASAAAPYLGVPRPDVVGPVPEAQLAEMKRLAQTGQAMQAIKLYRETFDNSMAEAQAAVARLAAGESLAVTSTPVDMSPAAPDPMAQMAEAARLAQAGQIEKAIRLVRELHPDMAPDVAQDVVDALAGRAGTRLDTRRGR